MTDEDTKKLEEVIKNTIRPLKELVEVLKSKVNHQNIYLTSTSSNIRSVKEQQSVINEKLDEVQQTIKGNAKKLDALWDQTVKLTENSEEIKDALKFHKTSTNNTDNNVKRVDKRLNKVESKLGIVPPPELTITS